MQGPDKNILDRRIR